MARCFRTSGGVFPSTSSALRLPLPVLEVGVEGTFVSVARAERKGIGEEMEVLADRGRNED